MPLPSLAETFGWLSDLFAQHIFQNDVPLPMRRRLSFDGDGWTVTDDPENEMVRVTFTEAGAGQAGYVPSPTVANTVLRSTDGSTITWGSIVNAMVDAAAAIAGTKITPDFGAQHITTTGGISLSNTPHSTQGAVRLGNNNGLYARDAANTQNIRGIHIDTVDVVNVGDASYDTTIDGNVIAIESGSGMSFTSGDTFSITASADATLAAGDGVSGSSDNGFSRQLVPVGTASAGWTEQEFTFRGALSAGAAASAIFSIAGGSGDREYYVEVEATAFETGGTDRAVYRRVAAFKTVAGTTTLLGAVSNAFTAEDTAAWDLTLDANSNNIRVLATADATNATTFQGTIKLKRCIH